MSSGQPLVAYPGPSWEIAAIYECTLTWKVELPCSLAVRRLQSREVVAKENDKDGGISIFKKFVLVRFSRFREVMKVIDTRIETNAIHKGLHGREGNPLPVEYDTGGATTIPEIP
jgi:hypothetical protein